MGVTGGASQLTERASEIIEQLPGGAPLVNSIEYIVAWARANSLWPLVYGTACCAMEMMAAGSSRHDWARFGVEVARATPRQADLIIIAGTVVEKMAPNLVTLYEQMPGPKYVIAMGSCAISGGPFYYDSYSVIKGGDRLIPVDVYIPGCPPRPESLLYGIMELQHKIRKEGRHNPWSIKPLITTPIEDLLTKSKTDWNTLEIKKNHSLENAKKQFKKYHPDHKAYKPHRIIKEKFGETKRHEQITPTLPSGSLHTIIKEFYPQIQLFNNYDATVASISELGSNYILDYEISSDKYLEFLKFLKDNHQLSMDMLLQLTAIDWKDHFDVVVQLLSTQFNHKIFIRCSVDAESPEIPSICKIYKGAEWHEREAYDLFGIQFINHPDLRRIFLDDTFSGHPLRKDFSDPARIVKRPY